MKKTVFVVFLFFACPFFYFTELKAQGPYPPAAGQTGSTAISKDSNIFISWAHGIEVNRGWQNIANPASGKVGFGLPGTALNQASNDHMDAISLGDSGEAVLTFDRPIVNADGFDFAVFGTSLNDTILELAKVSVSSDGVHFIEFPATSLTQQLTQITSADPLDPTNLNNVAGKYRFCYGTPFDLDEIADSNNIDLNRIHFVKVHDVVGSINPVYATYDIEGNIINEAWPTTYDSSGFDLESIGVINGGMPFFLGDFENLPLENDTFWNGSDGSGFFISDSLRFNNEYSNAYMTWTGFSYSNQMDVTTPGYNNQYSAYTGGGMGATDSTGTNYAVAYVGVDWQSGTYEPIPVTVDFLDSAALHAKGFYVSNSTYAALGMLNGGIGVKKFGGSSGNDPDWFRVLIWGEDYDNNPTDTITFYLADYRPGNSDDDYILDQWQWVDLQLIGKTKKLFFVLESTDSGQFGMNTPAYFCMENLTVLPDQLPEIVSPVPDLNYAVGEDSLFYFSFAPYFTDPDDPDTLFEFRIISNTNPEVAWMDISNDTLVCHYNSDGNTTIIIEAESNSKSIQDTIIVAFEPVTVIDVNKDYNVSVYPNPTQGSIFLNNIFPGSEIKIFSSEGRTIFRQKSVSSEVKIDIEPQPSGAYFLEIRKSNYRGFYKIIKTQ